MRSLVLSLCLLSASVAAHADQFTITGANTVTFSLPSTVTPASFVNNQGFILNNVVVTYNNVQETESVVIFNDGIIIGDNNTGSITGGGFLWTYAANNEISDDYANVADAAAFNGMTSAPLYSGSESSPTFLPGTYILTQDQYYSGDTQLVISAGAVAPAVPEPSSLALLGTGLLGVVGTIRRRIA